MKYALSFLILVLSSGLAFSQVSAVDKEKPSTEQASDKAKTATAVDAGDEKGEFKPPPGFRQKKRGKFVLYCIKDSTVGTRFKTEKCYDLDQMKAYLLAREQNNRDFDQRRAICSNPEICAPP